MGGSGGAIFFLDQSGGANGAGRGRGVARVAVWVLLVGWA